MNQVFGHKFHIPVGEALLIYKSVHAASQIMNESYLCMLPNDIRRVPLSVLHGNQERLSHDSVNLFLTTL